MKCSGRGSRSLCKERRMEEEGDIYDGVRAQFPLSFGKQSKPQTPLEAIHNATRRSNSNPKTANDLPSVSSSSRDWLNSLRPPKTPTPPPPLPPPDHDDGPMVGPPPPPPTAADEEEDDDDAEMIGPPPPPPIASESEDDSDQDEVGTRFRIPLSNEIVLKGHTKVVSALAVDHTGSRVLSGSYDYMVRMYDFQGMNARLESFRQLEPFEGHQVRNLSWSPTADRFLCVTGSAQAKIYDRDGLTLGEFVKGDMYIRDLKNTKGHISGLTCGEWHPKTKETILTSSEDGSLRIWDVNDFKSQKQVIKPKLARPGRVPVTTCAWDHDGKCIAGGIGDGSIQIWNIKPGWGSRPDVHIEKSHEDDISGLKFSSDGRILLSRSFDGSLKVWDLRKTKEPLKVFEDLPNHYAQTNIAFSPDERLFLTGTSVERESMTGGLLCFFDRVNLELVSKVGISPTCSVVQCSWHPKLNQIFATTGDKSQGGTHILYDPTVSERGALVCVARAPRKKSIDDFEAKPVIHNPHALPLFRDQPSRKRQREKVLKDPLKSHKPELPMTGPGFGGRVGTSQGSLLTQYLLKKGGMIKETWMEEDPREAILKYADAAAKDPKFIAPAYAETQPEPVFAKSDSEDEEK
ncbi:WD repeat-containing protein 70 [Glycine soja]|nr:WD repeat-containing protein 70 [Glycine soja]